MPSPTRQILVHIPPGRGLTHANLRRLEYLSRFRNYLLRTKNDNSKVRNEENAIYARIARNGGHNNIAAARQFTAPYIKKFNNLRRALVSNNEGNWVRNLFRERDNKAWGRVQEAAGRFKKRGQTAKQLRELAIMLGGGQNAYLLAQLVRRHGVSPGSPIRRTRGQFRASVERGSRTPGTIKSPRRRARTARRRNR
jgi:hypothetical protein